MIQCKDKYYIFSTGQGILSKSSKDQVFWSAGPPIFNYAAGMDNNRSPGIFRDLLGAGYPVFQ
jgi:hypothetical protein